MRCRGVGKVGSDVGCMDSSCGVYCECAACGGELYGVPRLSCGGVGLDAVPRLRGVCAVPLCGCGVGAQGSGCCDRGGLFRDDALMAFASREGGNDSAKEYADGHCHCLPYGFDGLCSQPFVPFLFVSVVVFHILPFFRGVKIGYKPIVSPL